MQSLLYTLKREDGMVKNRNALAKEIAEIHILLADAQDATKIEELTEKMSNKREAIALYESKISEIQAEIRRWFQC